MTSLRAFFEWMGTTPWSVAIHESLLMYPIIEAIHVLGICLFFGMVMMLDLRLLGFTLRDVPVTDVTRRLLPWTFAGFVPMVITGFLLVYQEPLRAYDNYFFRAKAIMLVLAGVNALAFHTGIYRKVADWDNDPVAPFRARIAGAFSLILWLGVIVCGRLIAYNWFGDLTHGS
jgi:hypothetical protein